MTKQTRFLMAGVILTSIALLGTLLLLVAFPSESQANRATEVGTSREAIYTHSSISSGVATSDSVLRTDNSSFAIQRQSTEVRHFSSDDAGEGSSSGIEDDLGDIPEVWLSTNYRATREDLALSPEEQLLKFGFVLTPATEQSSAPSTIRPTSIPSQGGWPQFTGGQIPSSPAVGDLHGDGTLEVIVGSAQDFKLFAWNHDGTLVPGFPFQTEGAIVSSPALADLDGDGKLEIIFGSFDFKVYALHHDGTIVDGWPVETGDWVRSSPAVVDLDGDGSSEIVVGSNDGHLYVLKADGTVSCTFQTSGSIVSSPAVADLDGDGTLEIIFGSWNGNVYAIDATCNILPGWPQTVGGLIIGSASVGDLDRDGQLEVVIGAGFGGSNQIYAFHLDGSLVGGWPVNTFTSVEASPAIVDLDNDGEVEIIFGSMSAEIFVLSPDGTHKNGWPFVASDSLHSSAAVGDITGDGQFDVVEGSDDKNLYALHRDGTLVSGFPIQTGGDVRASPVLADLDGDGDIEIIFASFDHKVYVLDLPTAYKPSRVPWKMFRHDRWHTGATFTFEDVWPHHWAWRFIETVYEAGITAGCIENNLRFVFCPAQQVSRAQMAVFLSRGMNLQAGDLDVFSPPACGEETFSDVICTHWAYKFIEYVASKGLASGFGDGTFRPDTTVNRAQMAVFLSRARDATDSDLASFSPPQCGGETFSDVGCDHWAYKFVEYVASKGITAGFPDGTYHPDTLVSRGQMSVFLVRTFSLL